MSFQSLHDGLPYLVHICAFSVMVNAPLFTHLAAVESIVPLHCIVLSLLVFFARFTSCFYILCFSSSLTPINYSVPTIFDAHSWHVHEFRPLLWCTEFCPTSPGLCGYPLLKISVFLFRKRLLEPSRFRSPLSGHHPSLICLYNSTSTRRHSPSILFLSYLTSSNILPPFSI